MEPQVITLVQDWTRHSCSCIQCCLQWRNNVGPILNRSKYDMENVCDKPLSSWPNLNTATSRRDSNWFKFVLIAVLTWVAATCFGNNSQGAPCPQQRLVAAPWHLMFRPLIESKSYQIKASPQIFKSVPEGCLTINDTTLLLLTVQR